MGMFGDLMGKIFGRDSKAAPQGIPTATRAPESQVTSRMRQQNPSPTPSGASATAGATAVDVEAILNGMAATNKEKLDWRRSIVDLMKLVGMDSSLSARKELAKELGYSGDTNDSATMNMWLHKQVMRKLAENGGRVPKDLLD